MYISYFPYTIDSIEVEGKIIETITIAQFRRTLSQTCRAVRVNGKEFEVTYYEKPLFKVCKVSDTVTQEEIEVTLTYARDRKSEFLDLLQRYEAVVLTTRGKRLARCLLITKQCT